MLIQTQIQFYQHDKITFAPHILLENEKFRLYYTSGCEESQNFVVVVEDNFGQSCELEFDFQHDNGKKTEKEDDGKLTLYSEISDSLMYCKS